jgi:hypothetical protein
MLVAMVPSRPEPLASAAALAMPLYYLATRSVRLDPDAFVKLRETGPGRQSRINGLLHHALGDLRRRQSVLPDHDGMGRPQVAAEPELDSERVGRNDGQAEVTDEQSLQSAGGFSWLPDIGGMRTRAARCRSNSERNASAMPGSIAKRVAGGLTAYRPKSIARTTLKKCRLA